MLNMIMISTLGIVTFFNFFVIYHKFKKNRLADAVLDMSIFAIISFMFSKTITGLLIGMIASMLMSIYLWFYPPLSYKKTKQVKQEPGVFDDIYKAINESIEEIKKDNQTKDKKWKKIKLKK